LDKAYNRVTADDQVARLYLNALQNFVLEVSQKPGVPAQMVAILVDNLKRRGVALGHIENPFTLTLKEVADATKRVMDELGPTQSEESDPRRCEAINGKRRVEKYLQPFLATRVAGFKRSPAPRVRDMGTVMHLILQTEINQLLERAAGV
jgi:hypothetical protein